MKVTAAIEAKALKRINKKRAEQGLEEITITEMVAGLRATTIRDEYRAAMVEDAMEQAEIDLGEKP